MALNNWLERATKRYILNVDLHGMQQTDGTITDYASDANWIYDPDMSAVEGQPSKYWIITLDVVTLMTAPQMAAVDAAEESVATLDRRNGAVVEPDESITFENVRIRGLIELLNKRDNYLANRVIELQNRVQAMLDSTGGVGNMRTDGLSVPISATNTRPYTDAVQDYKDDINTGNQDTF